MQGCRSRWGMPQSIVVRGEKSIRSPQCISTSTSESLTGERPLKHPATVGSPGEVCQKLPYTHITAVLFLNGECPFGFLLVLRLDRLSSGASSPAALAFIKGGIVGRGKWKRPPRTVANKQSRYRISAWLDSWCHTMSRKNITS
ncbi:hypothetical protein CLAIMM_06725 [Cladophialophora immunda]|nr:hypothetical protein CLAIMM_06725 [Cladophialophora immunda]